MFFRGLKKRVQDLEQETSNLRLLYKQVLEEVAPKVRGTQKEPLSPEQLTRRMHSRMLTLQQEGFEKKVIDSILRKEFDL